MSFAFFRISASRQGVAGKIRFSGPVTLRQESSEKELRTERRLSPTPESAERFRTDTSKSSESQGWSQFGPPIASQAAASGPKVGRVIGRQKVRTITEDTGNC
jgi:hypothetical protein